MAQHLRRSSSRLNETTPHNKIIKVIRMKDKNWDDVVEVDCLIDVSDCVGCDSNEEHEHLYRNHKNAEGYNVLADSICLKCGYTSEVFCDEYGFEVSGLYRVYYTKLETLERQLQDLT